VPGVPGVSNRRAGLYGPPVRREPECVMLNELV